MGRWDPWLGIRVHSVLGLETLEPCTILKGASGVHVHIRLIYSYIYNILCVCVNYIYYINVLYVYKVLVC